MVSQISPLSAIRKASRWQRKGSEWHFHLLSPGCLFNPTKMHELFLESHHGNYVARSARPLTSAAHVLLALLKKRGITHFSSTPAKGRLPPVLKRARHLTRKKTKWHHHLLFPHCIFNKKWGRWVIAFEDPLNNKITELVYHHFPAEDLKKIEKLFYSQRK